MAIQVGTELKEEYSPVKEDNKERPRLETSKCCGMILVWCLLFLYPPWVGYPLEKVLNEGGSFDLSNPSVIGNNILRGH